MTIPNPELIVLGVMFILGVLAFAYDYNYKAKSMRTVKVVQKHHKVIGGFFIVETVLIAIFIALI